MALPAPSTDESLDRLARDLAAAAIVRFRDSKLAPADLGISILELDRPKRSYRLGHCNGDAAMYPASVVKLVFAACLAAQLDAKEARLTAELDRAMRDMLVESSNDGAALVLDTVTGTTGGPELSAAELKRWMDKRQRVNRWLAAIGIPGQNVCQKPWNEGPYGRERQGYGPKFELRNSMTANGAARVMAGLALGTFASPKRSDWALAPMKRAPGSNGDDPGGQTKGFLGEGLPKEWERFSKAGWAYQVRHDVAYVKAHGREWVLAVFTDRHGSNVELLPYFAREFAAAVAR